MSPNSTWTFGLVNFELLQLSDAALRTYMALLKFANRRTGRCHPTQETLAAVAGRSSRTIRAGLAELAAKEDKQGNALEPWITITARGRGKGASSNEYLLHRLPALSAEYGQQVSAQCGSQLPADVEASFLQNENQRTRTKNEKKKEHTAPASPPSSPNAIAQGNGAQITGKALLAKYLDLEREHNQPASRVGKHEREAAATLARSNITLERFEELALCFLTDFKHERLTSQTRAFSQFLHWRPDVEQALANKARDTAEREASARAIARTAACVQYVGRLEALRSWLIANAAQVTEHTPELVEYSQLAEACGWEALSPEAVRAIADRAAAERQTRAGVKRLREIKADLAGRAAHVTPDDPLLAEADQLSRQLYGLTYGLEDVWRAAAALVGEARAVAST